MIHSIYRLCDGAFTGATVSGSARLVELNTPDGCALMQGQFDHLSQRVDLSTGKVVDWQPPKPDDTPLVRHEWNRGTKRWVRIKTQRALDAEHDAAIAVELAAIDAKRIRPLAEMMVKRDAWLAREQLERLEAQADALRARMKGTNSNG